MTTLSDRLAQAMARRPGTTQADLARLTGAKSSSVSNWFGGRTKTLAVEHAHTLGAFFGCDPQWLSVGVGSPRWDEKATVAQIPLPPRTQPTIAEALDTICETLESLTGMRQTAGRAVVHQVIDEPARLDEAVEVLEAQLAAESTRGKRWPLSSPSWMPVSRPTRAKGSAISSRTSTTKRSGRALAIARSKAAAQPCGAASKTVAGAGSDPHTLRTLGCSSGGQQAQRHPAASSRRDLDRRLTWHGLRSGRAPTAC